MLDSAKPINRRIGGFAGVRNRRDYVISLPAQTAPEAKSTMGVSLALFAAGAVCVGPNAGVSAPWAEFAVPPAAQKLVDRRRRYSTASEALTSIRLWSGLAWASIAQMLQVSCRTVHLWASGDEPKGSRAEQLAALHDRAEQHAHLGQATTGALLGQHYGVQVRNYRTPRKLVNPGAILIADNRPLERQPTSTGVRKIRRSSSV